MAVFKDLVYLRVVLTCGATVFGLSALLLLISPRSFNELLGFTSNGELEWAMRMIAITLLALCGNMISVSTRSTAQAVLFSSRVMAISAAALGVLTLLIPVKDLSLFDYGYALIGFGFSTAYVIGILRANIR